MDILISNASQQPLYEQIVEQIKNMVLNGKLNEGDALPSMRLLAKDLRISVITTKRAYEELERDGFIFTVPGRGSFVAGKNLEAIKEEQLKKIENHFIAANQLARGCGISLEELIEILKLLQQEE